MLDVCSPISVLLNIFIFNKNISTFWVVWGGVRVRVCFLIRFKKKNHLSIKNFTLYENLSTCNNFLSQRVQICTILKNGQGTVSDQFRVNKVALFPKYFKKIKNGA